MSDSAAQQAYSRLTQEDEAALHQTVTDNVRLALAGDWKSFASQFAEDAVLMPPNAPPVLGRDAILEAFENVTFTDFSSKLLSTSGCGDVAYGRGEHSLTMIAEGASEPVVDSGKWLGIWRKQADGSWLIAFDMWNANE